MADTAKRGLLQTSALMTAGALIGCATPGVAQRGARTPFDVASTLHTRERRPGGARRRDRDAYRRAAGPERQDRLSLGSAKLPVQSGLDAPSDEVGGFMVCWNGMPLALAPVPEPVTAAMLLQGLGVWSAQWCSGVRRAIAPERPHRSGTVPEPRPGRPGDHAMRRAPRPFSRAVA